MSIRYFFLAIFISSVIHVHPADAGPDPGGFLGLKWSQSPAECKKLGLCSAETISTEDRITGEAVFRSTVESLDGVALRFSSCSFRNNKYYLGVASFDPTGSAFSTLRQALTTQHGPPRRESFRMASWTVGNTRIQLTDGKTVGGLVYAHIPAYTEVAKAKKYPLPDPPKAPKTPKKK